MDVLTAEFQRSVVRLMVQDPSFLAEFRHTITKEVFQEDVDQEIAGLVTDHFDTYGTAPDKMAMEAVFEKLGVEEESQLEVFEEYFDTAVTQSSFIKDSYGEYIAKRRIERAIDDAATKIHDSSSGEICSLLLGAVNEAARGQSRGLYWDVKQRKRLRSYKDQEHAGCCPTGVSFIDSCTGGGLRPGEVGVVLAPPNTGKTTSLVSFGKGALMNEKRVLHFSLEMSDINVMRRYDMSILGMTKAELRRKQRSAWEKMEEAANRMLDRALHVKEYPMNSVDVTGIRGYSNTLANRDGFYADLIIVDYAARMKSGSRYDDRRSEIADVYYGIHALAKELHIPIWTAHQTNRQAVNVDVPGMEDLGECFEIASIVDVIVGCNQTPDQRRKNIMTYHFAKNREEAGGLTDTVNVDFSKARVW